MKESDALEKECPLHVTAMTILVTEAAKTGEVSREEGEIITSIGRCSGSECMMWVEDNLTADHGDCGYKLK